MAPLNVAVIGAGPAGIYASDILSKSGLEVNIDLFERLPAPYGLVRYGVAPDHPRIKQIIVALYKILQRGDIRLLGNVEVGRDVSIDDLRDHYDAIVIATGADRDHPLDIPGVDLPESYGAADFVSWYDGNPDYPRTWPLQARQVAVIGVGNVALDVSRVLAKHAEDMLKTEVPANVAQALAENPITDVHVFGRRGPAQVKFTPLELRELGKVPDVDVIVSEEDFDFDEGSEEALRASNQQRQVVKTLTNYAMADEEEHTASRRIHIHLFQSPVEIVADERGHVKALRTERTALNGDGSVSAGAGRLSRGWLLLLPDPRTSFRQASGRGAQRRGARHRGRDDEGRVRGRCSRRVRHRMDQARSRRADRLDQIGCAADDHAPGGGCDGGAPARQDRGGRPRGHGRPAGGARRGVHDLGGVGASGRLRAGAGGELRRASRRSRQAGAHQGGLAPCHDRHFAWRAGGSGHRGPHRADG